MKLRWDDIVIIFCFIGIIVFVGLSVNEHYDGNDVHYKMSENVSCEHKVEWDGRVTFYDCTDGKEYINPESYSKIIKGD